MRFIFSLKYLLFGILIIPKLSFAQQADRTRLEGQYKYYNEPYGPICILKCYKKGRFEYIIDDPFDCTPLFVCYGIGNFRLLDSNFVELQFDSLQALSSHKINVLPHEFESSTIEIKVENENEKSIDYVNVSWGQVDKNKSILKNKTFDKNTTLVLHSDQKEVYIEIKKIGYLSEKIRLPLSPKKDYEIVVTLIKEGNEKSRILFPKGKIEINFPSKCELLIDGRILKKENCP